MGVKIINVLSSLNNHHQVECCEIIWLSVTYSLSAIFFLLGPSSLCNNSTTSNLSETTFACSFLRKKFYECHVSRPKKWMRLLSAATWLSICMMLHLRICKHSSTHGVPFLNLYGLWFVACHRWFTLYDLTSMFVKVINKYTLRLC